jgi:hypothetical protein
MYLLEHGFISQAMVQNLTFLVMSTNDLVHRSFLNRTKPCKNPSKASQTPAYLFTEVFNLFTLQKVDELLHFVQEL